MKDWIKEHCIEAIVCAITLLGYFGVSASDLLGIAQYANYIMPFIYLGVGIFFGWRLRSYNLKERIINSNPCGATTKEESPTKDEIIDSFAHIPFEIKIFLKAALENGAVYRDTNDYAWTYYDESLSPFIQCTTIRNEICRCTIRDGVRKQFEDIPSLLGDVQEKDIRPYAVRGNEGVKPQVFSANKLVWWYYTDDEDIPASFDLIGFMRQPPVM